MATELRIGTLGAAKITPMALGALSFPKNRRYGPFSLGAPIQAEMNPSNLIRFGPA